jgi:hypothetical protein
MPLRRERATCVAALSFSFLPFDVPPVLTVFVSFHALCSAAYNQARRVGGFVSRWNSLLRYFGAIRAKCTALARIYAPLFCAPRPVVR